MATCMQGNCEIQGDDEKPQIRVVSSELTHVDSRGLMRRLGPARPGASSIRALSGMFCCWSSATC